VNRRSPGAAGDKYRKKELIMTNPFENENATYLVLINEEAQYSLWPSFIDVPRGWKVAHPADSRQACLDYVNQHWTDMRPKSLVDAMASDAEMLTNNSPDGEIPSATPMPLQSTMAVMAPT
jgi:MbtH protein